jgi:hypothetical protein
LFGGPDPLEETGSPFTKIWAPQLVKYFTICHL